MNNGDKIQVFNRSDDTAIATGYLKDFSISKNKKYLVASFEDRSQINIDQVTLDREVIIACYSQKSPSSYCATIGDVSLPNIYFENIQKIDFNERRRNIKVYSNITCRVKRVYNKHKASSQAFDDSFHDVTIRNISIGGILFTSPSKFEEDEKLEIEIKYANRSFWAKLKILRLQLRPNDDIGYGCRFVDITTGVEDELGFIVNTLQMEEIRRARGR